MLILKLTICLGMLALLVLCSSCVIRMVGGASRYRPDQIDELSPAGKELLTKVFTGIDRKRVVDCHVHIAGMDPEHGNYFNEHMQTWWHSIKRFQFGVYMSATRMKPGDPDENYVQRLLELTGGEYMVGPHHLLALDKFHTEAGQPDLRQTEFSVSNRYVWSIAQRYPERFVPVISIHPYRNDAVLELERWARKGVKYVKWLPNAMGIDPRHERCIPFYKKLIENDMTLLTHTGHEAAIDAKEYQELGNPLYLRTALDLGVKVIMAHCASTGESIDLDDPEKKSIDSFELFARMMDNPAYKDQLYGDLSATTQFNRKPEILRVLLERTDWHPRLINGSDYPLPAINFLIQTRCLRRNGFITKAERKALNEIYHYNPLLFDLAVKRTLRHPESGQRFLPIVFHARKL